MAGPLDPGFSPAYIGAQGSGSGGGVAASPYTNSPDLVRPEVCLDLARSGNLKSWSVVPRTPSIALEVKSRYQTKANGIPEKQYPSTPR